MDAPVVSPQGAFGDKDLRILIFTAAYFVLDGVTLTIRRLESHLRSKGATVKICTTGGEGVDPEQASEVIIVPGIKIPLTAAGTGYALGVGLDEATIRKIEEYNPNCCHFTVPDFVALDGIRWCQARNVAYMGTWHSNYVDYLKYYNLEMLLAPTVHRFLKSFFQQIPSVYVPTPYMLSRLKEWGYDDHTMLKEWGRGIDLKLFSPQRRSNTFRMSKGINETDIVVLWVGRLVPEKRVDIWIHVINKLKQEGYSVKGLVVGNGTYEKSLSELHHVICCGWLSGEALAEAYASSDVLLFPSDVETFGNVTLEALASGCPCVVEKNCGEHLVEHERNGYTCEAGNFEDFYERTKNIIIHTDMRKKMSHNARQFSWKFERGVILQQMLENYKHAIKQFQDPNFIKNYSEMNPEFTGRNFLSMICCNYWLLKNLAEPLLNTTQGLTNMVQSTNECVHTSRNKLSYFQCDSILNSHSSANSLHSLEHPPLLQIQDIQDIENRTSRYEDEKKGRHHRIVATILCIFSKITHYTTMSFSLGLIMVFIYATFTV